MNSKNRVLTAILYFGLLLAALVPADAFATAPELSEDTPDVAFTSASGAQDLATEAASLKTPLAMYEYVRNNFEFALYQGARGGSENTFGGQRGNDVDTDSTLIAMLRSQGYPARYAVGTVKRDIATVENWLGVKDPTLAYELLRVQGIQQVQWVTGTNNGYIQFEQVWVEVLTHVDNYRGAGTDAQAPCSLSDATCKWVPLAPAFKLRNPGGTLDTTADPNFPGFDYTGYYNAIKKSDPTMLNKNPLDIYEEEILGYVRPGNPGTTLADVEDRGGIKQEALGLLPLSLPFEIVSSVPVRHYNSVADHDEQVGSGKPESKLWEKYVYIDVYQEALDANGNVINGSAYFFQNQPVLLTSLATQQLTLTFTSCTNGTEAHLRLNGAELPPMGPPGMQVNPTPSPVCDTSGNLSTGTPIVVTLRMDGAPDPTGGTNDSVVKAQYINDVVGGYYLIGTGGDTSNWSQVHRAAAQLLQANANYTILNGPSNLNDPTSPQIPYVDSNQDGVVDTGDTPLIDDPQAMDDLTGGLLYTAMTLYYAQAHDAAEELAKLDHVAAPIDGWIGMVSSVDDVQYIDGTSYSIMPGGLLIDMKGVQFSTIVRDDQPDQYDSAHFELLGHIFSSYEHETWQELTGYDAISTVRGIQMALANGANLEDLTSSNFVSSYSAFGYNTTPPAEFTLHKWSIYGTASTSWAFTNDGSDVLGFAALRATVDSSVDVLHQQPIFYESLAGSQILGETLDTFDANVSADYKKLSSEPSSTVDTLSCYPDFWCGVNGLTAGQLLPILQNNIWVPTYNNFTIGALPLIPSLTISPLKFFPYLDRDKGFSPANWVYSALPQPLNQYDPYFMIGLRTTMAMTTDPVTGAPVTHEIKLPSTRISGPTYLFSVYISKEFDSNNELISEGYEISNQSWMIAGGGYVDPGTKFVDPNKGQGGTAFNNAQLNDKTLTSMTNNNTLITPSTSDPVSTVTGNMYHDETDFTIHGRGLDYTFTRTYNSNVAGITGNGAPFSVGWTHSYNMQLTANDYGANPDYPQSNPQNPQFQAPENGNGTTSSITYTDERGGQWNYLVDDLPDSSGNVDWTISAPKGMFATLTMDIPVSGQSGVFQDTLAFGNGVTYTFQGGDLKVPGQSAHLVQIQDAYGDQLLFGYDSNNRLSTVTDNLGVTGRTGLTLTYYSNGQLETISDWTGRTWTYAYDSAGNLSSVTDPLSQKTTYIYQPGTHLVTGVIRPAVRNGTPVETQFSYYRNDRAFNYSDALGDTETLDYDLFSKSTRVTDARGFSMTQYYDQNGSLTGIHEKDGGLLYFGNNADLLRNSKQDALGYSTTYTYDQARTFGAGSDTDGQVTQETDALGNKTQTDYSQTQTADGTLVQTARRQDKNGNQLFYDYYTSADTGSGVVIGKLKDLRIQSADAAEDGLNNTTIASFTYYPSGAPAMRTEYISSGHARVTTLTYYPGDVDVSDKWVVGGGTAVHTHYTYDSLDRMLTSTVYRATSPTDPTQLALTTTWTYDAMSRMQTVTDPDGNIQETVYDADGLVSQKLAHYLQPDNSYITRTLYTNTYDAADRLVSRTDTDGDIVQYSYDATGDVLTQTDPNGNVTHFEYDAMGRRTAVIDANGNRTETKYDLDGHMISVKDANGNTTTFAYDALGRKASVVTQLGNTTKMSYDADGNVIGVQDADLVAGVKVPTNQDHDTTSEYYDGLGRATAVIDANNGETDKTYDLIGDVTSINDPAGHQTTMVYDDLGRLITVEDPLATTTGKTTQYTYDEAGNVLTKTDRNGAVTQYFYDYLNRLYLTKFLADGTSETRHYNSVGDLDTVSNANVTYSYVYDDMHRLKQVTDSRNNKAMSWAYDKAGNIVQKTDFQGDVTSYQYDSTNRLIAESNKAYVQASYQYDGAGRLVSRILSSGARTIYSYDADNRLLNLSNYGAGGTLLESLTYGRDPVGNITAITRQDASGTSSTNYTYDTRYELTGVDAPGTVQDLQYTYDAVGNRKALFQADPNNPGQYIQQYGYQYDADNRLNEIDQGTGSTAVKTYGYDADGQRTSVSDGSGNLLQQIAWDQKGRIASVTQGGQTSTMAYDPSDYRISKQTSLSTNNYYLEDKNLEAVYDSNGNLKQKYLRGAVVDELIYGYSYDSNGKGTAATYHHDQVTSVTDETAPDGTVLASFQYDPFGNVISSSGTPVSDLQYTGRNFDSESGLYYYRARYYDPTVGRFISQDPTGFVGGLNFYTYALNNPLQLNDPQGKWAGVDDLLALGGGALAGVSATLVTDFVTGQPVTAQDLVSSAVGGATAGETLLYTANPVAAGAAGGAAKSLVDNAWDYVTAPADAKPTVTAMVINTVVDTGEGALSGYLLQYLPPLPIPGVTTGSNSFAAVSSQIDTKLANGTISNVSLTTMTKIFTIDSIDSVNDGLLDSSYTGYGEALNLLMPTTSISAGDSNVSSTTQPSAAAGGFVIYPDQLNLNSAASVYSKGH